MMLVVSLLLTSTTLAVHLGLQIFFIKFIYFLNQNGANDMGGSEEDDS
jgi:hypothetical protein